MILIVTTSFSSCVTFSERQSREYGTLISAVTFSSDKVIGEYGDAIPNDFSKDEFMQFIKDKIPEYYYKILRKYDLDLKSMDSYYLLLVYNPKSNVLILFDYSCTPEADGTFLLKPEEYDINNLELYDHCKEGN